jgi:hypothetical protein
LQILCGKDAEFPDWYKGLCVWGAFRVGTSTGQVEVQRSNFATQYKETLMSDRRAFMKGAGILSLLPWAKSLPAQPRNEDESGPSDNGSFQAERGAIVIENAEMRLVVSSSGSAQSLVHKPSGQECLARDTRVPMFNVTQYRPYDNELQLAYPAKKTHFPADRVRREGDRLIVSFTSVGYEATIGLKITDAYIAFRLVNLTYNGYTPLTTKEKTTIDETLFVQLPIRDRKNLGEWLNVMWDEGVAVNVLATDPYAQIDAKDRGGYHLFQAGTVRDVQLEGVGAALITTTTPQLLDRIARVEEDFNLPRGVESRRRREYRYSYYQAIAITPQDADRQIKFAKMGGFRTMNVYCLAFAKTVGHFPWRPEYPRGMADLQEVVTKISGAGMLPGLHILYTMAHEEDAYVTPIPDPRLNLLLSFTLAEGIDAAATVIPIEENPRLCTTEDGKRILKIQNELIAYQEYTTSPPYQFQGCHRGALGTHAAPHEMSSRVGLLDMYGQGLPSWLFVRFTQDTSIQSEVADRLKAIYEQAGFKFVYFDGAEQVPPPYWYTVSQAQAIIADPLQPKPLFAEGSCKSHFSWHILTRGNAFDVFTPEKMKAATRAYPATEIQRVANDFTSINFGWIGYWAPSKETIGTQPDMLEYVTSRAAAWDCPISLSEGSSDLLSALEAHPRTGDNLEVIRRWEDLRAQEWLTQEQKIALRNLEQEHTLLVDERGEFVLVPWDQIEGVAGAKAPARAFVFERNRKVCIAYWHTSGEALLEVALEATQLTLMREFGKPLAVKGNAKTVKLPLGDLRYVEFHQLTRQEAIAAFQNARILPS